MSIKTKGKIKLKDGEWDLTPKTVRSSLVLALDEMVDEETVDQIRCASIGWLELYEDFQFMACVCLEVVRTADPGIIGPSNLYLSVLQMYENREWADQFPIGMDEFNRTVDLLFVCNCLTVNELNCYAVTDKAMSRHKQIKSASSGSRKSSNVDMYFVVSEEEVEYYDE